MHKPAELLDAALCAVDEAREVFVDKVGAAPALRKGAGVSGLRSDSNYGDNSYEG